MCNSVCAAANSLHAEHPCACSLLLCRYRTGQLGEFGSESQEEPKAFISQGMQLCHQNSTSGSRTG